MLAGHRWKTRSPPDYPLRRVCGRQDDNSDYGATFAALNVWNLDVKWRSTPTASLELAAQLPTAAFDSVFPCAPTARDCLPDPGITNPDQYLDVLSYRQRPTLRLAYRNVKSYESLVTSQTVEASVAGERYPGIRYTGRLAGDPLGQMTLGGDDQRRLRRSDGDELALGRLLGHDGRPGRRLHLLVRQRVLPHVGNRGRQKAVAHPNRELQAPEWHVS